MDALVMRGMNDWGHNLVFFFQERISVIKYLLSILKAQRSITWRNAVKFLRVMALRPPVRLRTP